MNLLEIKEWRATLQASSHTMKQIDALIGMVEELLRGHIDSCDIRIECEGLTCVECSARFKAKYGVTE